MEKNTWTRPDEETTTRPAYYTSTYNGTSDLAGQISAALTSAAMVFQDSDPAYYAELMEYSTLMYAAGARNRATYTYSFNYPCAEDVDSTNVVSAPQATCLPADELFQGAMIGTYNSTSYLDDLTWAAAWLNMATGDEAYLTDAYRCVACGWPLAKSHPCMHVFHHGCHSPHAYSCCKLAACHWHHSFVHIQVCPARPQHYASIPAAGFRPKVCSTALLSNMPVFAAGGTMLMPTLLRRRMTLSIFQIGTRLSTQPRCFLPTSRMTAPSITACKATSANGCALLEIPSSTHRWAEHSTGMMHLWHRP